MSCPVFCVSPCSGALLIAPGALRKSSRSPSCGRLFVRNFTPSKPDRGPTIPQETLRQLQRPGGHRMFKNPIPKIFYDHLRDGLEFFVDGLGFEDRKSTRLNSS